MYTPQLSSSQRDRALEAMRSEEFDVVIVGGGVTGAGIALDAASRGLRTAIVEAQDWAAGTSSRSSRLVHGGLRYLYNLDFKLVAEALHERGLLLTKIAPHLVKAQPLLWPFKQRVIERAYSTLGVGLYDAMAIAGARGRKTVPIQRHLSKAGALRRFPGMKKDYLIGAMEYYDARVDDARLVLTLVRTAVGLGAEAASRTAVTGMTTSAAGRIDGVEVRDLETGEEFRISAKNVINASGVWTEKVQDLAGTKGGLKVLASKGIHIAVPRDAIQADIGMFLRTEKSVLFIVPWQHYWLIGTTDTAWHEQYLHPVPTSKDIDYVLEHANAVLDPPLTRDDIIGTWAGLRPLLQPQVLEETKSTKVSREHTVAEAAPGLTVIAGGKLTTYRVMAEDAVDFALGKAEAKARPSTTHDLPLVGAVGLDAMRAMSPHVGQKYAFSEAKVEHLLERYGSDLRSVLALIDDKPELGEALESAPNYVGAEVVFACTHEGAVHLEDIFLHRIRLNTEVRDRGLSAIDEVGALAAEVLGWSAERLDHEKNNYRTRVEAELAAESQDDDASASAARLEAENVVGGFDA